MNGLFHILNTTKAKIRPLNSIRGSGSGSQSRDCARSLAHLAEPACDLCVATEARSRLESCINTDK